MKIDFTYEQEEPIKLKRFLNQVGISHRMYRSLRDDGGEFYVQGKLVRDATINLGDQVTVMFPPEKSAPNVPFSDGPLTVMYEDKNWLVVNKPAGLTVVPGPANRDDTLVNRVKGYWQQNGEENLVPHIITRLDRFTSGVVLIAKHRLANSLANELMSAKRIDKQYLAVVSGTGLLEHGEIDKPLAKDPNGFGQIVSEDGKRALTEYWKINEGEAYTAVKVVLHTGRTHQIRVHFTSLGHPLLGDELYLGPLNLGIERQALHAERLSFNDPFTHEEFAFTAEIPADMKQYFD